jgi:Ankyrin repeats (3 copies)
VNAHYRGADVATFALHDAQLVLARAYGFASWPKLKGAVDGVTARQLIEAVRAGDLDKTETMLRVRPELAQNNAELITLLERHGGFLDAISAGFARQTDAARRLLEDEGAGRLRAGATSPGSTVAEDLLWTAAGGGDPEIVRLALERIDWPRDDERWMGSLWQALTCDAGVERGLDCVRQVLERADPNLGASSRTMLHTVMARGGQAHVPYAELLLDRGARTDIRDELLRSTPLGWACRWGRLHFVELLLARGADPVERDAEPWATPMAWAERMKHDDVVDVLRRHSQT